MAESAPGPRADMVHLQVHAQLLELREAAEGAGGHLLAAVVTLGGGGLGEFKTDLKKASWKALSTGSFRLELELGVAFKGLEGLISASKNAV